MQENLVNHLQNHFELDPEVGAVVVGFDQHISYPKMMKAASYLGNKECIFIATNTDEQFPHAGGQIIIPGNYNFLSFLYNLTYYLKKGTGSIVAAIQTCAARTPLVMGKPNTTLTEVISSSHDLNPARTLMIGDR